MCETFESSGTAKMSEKPEKMSDNAENGGWTQPDINHSDQKYNSIDVPFNSKFSSTFIREL